MKDLGYIFGDEEQALQPLIVGKDTVYVHEDPQEVEMEPTEEGEESKKGWKYHEIQYDKDEYIQLMSEKNAELEENIAEDEQSITDLEIAVAELQRSNNSAE